MAEGGFHFTHICSIGFLHSPSTNHGVQYHPRDASWLLHLHLLGQTLWYTCLSEATQHSQPDLPNLWLVPIPVTLLAVLGTFVLLVWVFSFLRAIAGATIIPGYDVHRFQSKKARSWAMVTGATSGIGLEFARQLGQSAFYIILVGRRKDALDEVAKELGKSSGRIMADYQESRWRIQTRVVVVDLAKPGEERDAAYMECKRLSEELDLAVLSESYMFNPRGGSS